jgi:hypothetical protein
VVFAGSSMIRQGFDHQLFTSRTGVPSINAALPASTNFLLEPWLIDVVVPRLHPRVVVIGVSSRDFNDNGKGPDLARDTFLNSPGYRTITGDDWMTRADRALSTVSALFRWRRSLREPSNVASAIRTRPLKIVEPECPKADPDDDRYTISKTVQDYPRSVLYDYSVGGAQTRALRSTIYSLHSRGIDVALLLVPATPDYDPLHPHGEADVRAYRAVLNDVVEDTGVTVIDATPIDDERYFRDAIHVNCPGRALLTRSIADRWEKITNGSSSRVRLSSPPR